MYENYLIHYGTLGMRWGRRKKQEGSRPKSKRILKAEQYYLNKGLSKKDAEIAAAKKIKIENIGLTFAGITLAAAVTYVAVNHYKNNVDKIIKEGSVLQNISLDQDKDLKDTFYASLKKSDNLKYRGLYGSHLNSISGDGVYERKFDVRKNLKLASPKTARNELSSLMKNPKYVDSVNKEFNYYKTQLDIGGSSGQKRVFNNAIKDLNNGKVSKNVYDAFNITLTDHKTETHTMMVRDFYDNLKRKGFDAIDDLNDSKYSGYGSKKPLVILDRSKLIGQRARKISPEEINETFGKAALSMLGEGTLKVGAGITTSILAVSGTKKVIDYNQEIQFMLNKKKN